MTGEQVWGVVRTILAAGGGVLVGKGYLTNEMLMAILGGLGTLFVGVWSVKAKKVQ